MTTISSTPSAKNSPVHKNKSTSTCYLILKKAKEILVLALKIIVLGGLALYQSELFLAGFLSGLVIKFIWRDKCRDAIRNVQEAVAKRPWFIVAISVTAAIVIPGSVLVIPPFVGGFYSGIKAANYCLK